MLCFKHLFKISTIYATPVTCNLFRRPSLPLKPPKETTTCHLQPLVTFSAAQNFKKLTGL
ncbi:hypothetical protein HanXRQr2_Chr06g0271741 [Helianthus annuus]|uniref:Uncharacterized protein n=1 Tax=Helianthus annuus TaxID=4232 RepID=A0A9K3IVM7_HELAN|nr:hypothetical protein HanXRQr2_Chr06g0271741 [Helianthus annuus]KAJ0916496.1 hypothetical protein HanPSC8_Chr06g0262331 [Helianthus annuus]